MANFNYYKHVNNTDVCFYPLTLEKESEESLTFYGRWINIVNTPLRIDEDTITIQKSDLHNWKDYDINVSTRELL